MDHNEAMNSQAVEKYFLGELKGAERDAFEEHFFDCAECAADVKTTAVLVDNVREVLRAVPADATKAPAREPRTSAYLTWWKPAYFLAAIALLVAVVGYQNFVTIPRLREGTTTVAQALPSYSFVTAGSRGAAGLEIAVPAHSPFGIYVDIPGDPGFTSYSADVVNQSGATKLSIPVSAEQTKDTVQLLIPGGTLEPGQYDLVIKGYKAGATAGQEIIRHPFILRTK
jgi:hypothetical protein